MSDKQLKFWFDVKLAILLAHKISQLKVDFDEASFLKQIKKDINKYELKDRIELIADSLYHNISGTYPDKLQVIASILGPENPNQEGMFTIWYWLMPVAKLVEKYGTDHFRLSTQMIKQITKRCTGEFAIREFLVKYPEQTEALMLNWSKDKSFHVRRLSSEGIRTRLPWTRKLNKYIENPAPILPILENLKDDPYKFVQKSVANNLNDIFKDNPQIAMKVIDSWLDNVSKQRAWIIKHALRNQDQKIRNKYLKIIKYPRKR